MSLITKIEADLTQALRAQESAKVSALRLLKNSLYNHAKAGGKEISALTDDEVVKIVQKELKQRQESVDSYKQGGRTELAAKEQVEIELFERYLPAQLDEAELSQIVDKAIAENGAQSLADMGKVMGALGKQLAGRADMAKVSELVKDRLTS